MTKIVSTEGYEFQKQQQIKFFVSDKSVADSVHIYQIMNSKRKKDECFIYILRYLLYEKKLLYILNKNDQEFLIVKWTAKWTHKFAGCLQSIVFSYEVPSCQKSGVLCIIMFVCLLSHNLPVMPGMKRRRRGLLLKGVCINMDYCLIRKD